MEHMAMSPKYFLDYDTDGIENPASIVSKLLANTQDSEHSLAMMELSLTEKQVAIALKTIDRDLHSIVQKLSKTLGEPSYRGTDSDQENYPSWAYTGTEVAYWQDKNGRIVYLIKYIPADLGIFELILGAVDNPQEDWMACIGA
jgi:hypothetical protein